MRRQSSIGLQVIIAVGITALAACASEPEGPRHGQTIVWRQDGTGARKPEILDRPADHNDRTSREDHVPTVVKIPPDVTRELSDFMTRKTTVIGEVVMVDVSRKPFLSASMFTASPDDVERTEEVDPTRGLLTMTLTNKTGIKTNLHALPRVELEGIQLVGVHQLVIRYWTKQTAERPLHLRAIAEGNAALLVQDAERAERGSLVTLEAEIREVGGRYQFDERQRVDP